MEKLQLIPSHAIGTFLLDVIHRIFSFFGIGHNETLQDIVYVAMVTVLSLFIGWAVKWIVVWLVRKLVSMRPSEFGRDLLEKHVISHCAHFIPPLVLLGLLPIAFNRGNRMLDILERIVGAYALVALGIGLAAVMAFIYYRYDKHENTKNLPLKGILNVGRGIMWMVIVIITVSVLLDKSPAMLLTGLGAFAAALMLIFKDSILGFVAGIQMSQNDMLHVGDWIVVPGTPANGVVTDVSLTAVKIQNFDNTFVTVPPYTLVSGSFQNWRGMKEAGARRMNPTLTIDMDSIGRLTPDMLGRALRLHPELQPFVDASRRAPGNVVADGGIRPLNGSLETNLGLYRAYATQYLLTSPLLNNTMQVLVQLMPPTNNGIPINFYCFTDTTDWNAYEAIQSTIIEHLTVVAPDFGLAIYYGGSMAIETVAAAPAAPAAPATDDKAS